MPLLSLSSNGGYRAIRLWNSLGFVPIQSKLGVRGEVTLGQASLYHAGGVAGECGACGAK